jgi:hypothetical protein
MDWRYQILKRAGFSVYRKIGTSGKTLEFLGTSGVGKTTLFHGCLRKLRTRWFSSYHIELLNRTARSCEPDEILMQVLKRKIEKILNSDSFCPWHSLIDLKLSVKVMYDTMLATQNTHPMGFAFHEGLFRHFCAEILELNDDFPAELWKSRAFIYLRARSPETALSRLNFRRSIKAKTHSHRVITDDELLSRITNDQQMFQFIVDKALSFGCPVLILDAEDPIQTSIEKVLNFERSLIEKFKMQENRDLNTKLIPGNQ